VSERVDRRTSFAPNRCSSRATLFDIAEGVVPSRSEAALKEPVSTVATNAVSPAILSEIAVIQDITAQIMCQGTILCADVSSVYACRTIQERQEYECPQR
jgi:hypothetical protein